MAIQCIIFKMSDTNNANSMQKNVYLMLVVTNNL